VPSHIHYILLELLKNSMRATVETHGINSRTPPIRIIISDGEDNEDVVGRAWVVLVIGTLFTNLTILTPHLSLVIILTFILGFRTEYRALYLKMDLR